MTDERWIKSIASLSLIARLPILALTLPAAAQGWPPSSAGRVTVLAALGGCRVTQPHAPEPSTAYGSSKPAFFHAARVSLRVSAAMKAWPASGAALSADMAAV